jgi:hypothetical protein
MQADHLTIDEVRRMAAAIGLTRLSEEHMQQLLHAANTAQVRRTALPLASLTPTDEPAHVFHFGSGAER